MRKQWWLFSIALVFLFLFSSQIGKSEAASLFQPNGSMANMFGDYKARQVGDTLTIIISEKSSSSQKASASTSKTSDANVDNVSVGTNPDNPITKFLRKFLPISHSSSNKSAGSGGVDQSGSLTAQMTATVTEVLPNGNLVVEGTKNISVNSETQEIYIKGTVRPADVTSDNTVDSNAIANAEIRYKGKGAVADTQKPGILTRILNWIF